MQHLTVAIADEVFAAYRQYAEEHGTSIEEVVRRVLAQGLCPAPEDWLEEYFRLMETAGADSGGIGWRREDLYHGGIA